MTDVPGAPATRGLRCPRCDAGIPSSSAGDVARHTSLGRDTVSSAGGPATTWSTSTPPVGSGAIGVAGPDREVRLVSAPLFASKSDAASTSRCCSRSKRKHGCGLWVAVAA